MTKLNLFCADKYLEGVYSNFHKFSYLLTPPCFTLKLVSFPLLTNQANAIHFITAETDSQT